MNVNSKNDIESLRQLLEDLEIELKPCQISEKANSLFREIEQIVSIWPENKTSGKLISAQASVYPLRVNSLSPCVEGALRAFHAAGLQASPGPMSTVIAGTEDQIWLGLRNAFNTCAEEAELVMAVTISNACPHSKTE